MIDNYLNAFSTGNPSSHPSDDEQFLIGTVLLDYFIPMLEDSYVLESLLARKFT